MFAYGRDEDTAGGRLVQLAWPGKVRRKGAYTHKFIITAVKNACAKGIGKHEKQNKQTNKQTKSMSSGANIVTKETKLTLSI